MADLPEAQLLERLLLGYMPPDEAERLLEQLDDPSALSEVTQSLAGKDTVVEALRAQATQPVAVPDTRLESLMKSLAAGVPAADTPSAFSEKTVAGDEVPAAPSTELAFLAPAQGPDEIGRLDGYRVLQVLGRGGMGLVLLAEDVQLRRRVALKVMRPEVAAGSSARERFLREAQSTAAIEHEHVVAIHAVSQDRGVPFLVMPLLKGEPLEDRLAREIRLPTAEVLRVGREIAEGLAGAHERGLIHRDVKPSNVWLEGARGKVKLLDFGLARCAEGDTPLTQSGTVMGTPAYMAPEQAAGEPVDGRADLFSLGCVLYQAATGQKPFTGPTIMAILRNLALHEPPSAKTINSAVPVELSDLIARMMFKDVSRRPTSAADVAAELAAIEERMKRPAPGPLAESGDSAEVALAAKPAALPRRAHGGWGQKIAVGLGLVAAVVGVLFAFGIIRIETPKGTLVIEGADDDVEVVIKQNGAIVKDKVKAREIELKVGDYTIELAEKPEGLRLSTKEFTITRGEKTPIKVYLDKAVARKEMPTAEGGDPDAVAAGPSPLDELDPTNIPEAERFPWQPKELVGIFGEGRNRHWGEVNAVAISPDGSLVAAGNGTLIHLWDVKTNQVRRVLSGHTKPVTGVAFADDGRTLVSATWGDRPETKRWEVATGKEVNSGLPGGKAHRWPIPAANGSAVVFQAEGQPESALTVWKPGDAKALCTMTAAVNIGWWVMSPDGKYVATADFPDGQIRLWDATSGKEAAVLRGHGQAPLKGTLV